eukprot:1973245-Rhodomonas_salina.1
MAYMSNTLYMMWECGSMSATVAKMRGCTVANHSALRVSTIWVEEDRFLHHCMRQHDGRHELPVGW